MTEPTPKRVRVRSDTGPFSIIPEWLLGRVSPTAYMLYGLLARYADDTGRCWPSRRTMAERLSCSMSTVDRAVDDLRKVGALVVVPRKDDERGQLTNDYRLIRAAPDASTPLVKSEQPPLLTDDTQNETHPERDSVPNGTGKRTALAVRSPEVEPSSGQERALLFKAVAEAWTGEPYTPNSLTKPARSRIAAAMPDLEAVGANPGEVHRRAVHYWHQYDQRPTPQALAAHWPALAKPPAPPIRGTNRSVVNGHRWAQRKQAEMQQEAP